MIRSARVAAACSLTLVPVAAAGQQTDDEWLAQPAAPRPRRPVVSDVRVSQIAAPAGVIRVDPGGNGGVAIEAGPAAASRSTRIEARVVTAQSRPVPARDDWLGNRHQRLDNACDASWNVNLVVRLNTSDSSLHAERTPVRTGVTTDDVGVGEWTARCGGRRRRLRACPDQSHQRHRGDRAGRRTGRGKHATARSRRFRKAIAARDRHSERPALVRHPAFGDVRTRDAPDQCDAGPRWGSHSLGYTNGPISIRRAAQGP